jgi:riboflavin synthase
MIDTMLSVASYEKNIADSPNKEIIFIAENISREMVLNIEKVLKNPSKLEKFPKKGRGFDPQNPSLI